ncbi:MAG: hypothetical protein PHW95_02225 [Patescibacteria group bacterium]|nr:hypothetical protein [Patescibacteria group bacterium]
MNIVSKFNETPKTKTAWQAMWLGVSTLLIFPALGIFAAIIRPIIDNISNETTGATMGFITGLLALIISVAALITAIRAYRLGERSWVLWIGFVPAILVGLFWIFMIVGEFLFPH